MDKINESVNLPKFEYFLKKYNDYENDVVPPKRGQSKNANNYSGF